MAWGTITIGALVLKEVDILTDATNANTGERAVKLEGRETVPGTTIADLEAKQEDIMGLIDRVFPVTFSRKAAYNGFYAVTDTNTEMEKWVEGPAQVRWSLSLTYLGPDNIVDMESRFANVVRANDFVLAGERWHAPAINHYSYQAGTATPATVVRTGADGPITVYRSVPAATSARWGITPANALLGRARILQGGIERVGVGITLTPGGWEVNNGLVRVRPESGGVQTTLRVAVWNGAAWSNDKSWDVRFGGAVVNAAQMRSAVVLRNDPEMCVVRVVCQAATSSARRTIDVGLRRGARFLEGYAQQASASAIVVTPDVTEAFVDTSAQGYLTATADDGDGVKYVVGSSKTFATDSAGGISKNAVTALDFFIGAVPGGTSLGVTDGDFETSVAGWNTSGGTFTRVNDQFKVGAWSAKLVTVGTPTQTFTRPAPVTVVPGVKYRASFWARSLAGRTIGCAIDWQISSVYQSTDANNAVVLPAGVWTWAECEAVCPAVPLGINEAVYGPTMSGSPTAGDTLWIDRVRFRVAVDPGDAASVLRDQYIGAMAEKVKVTRR